MPECPRCGVNAASRWRARPESRPPPQFLREQLVVDADWAIIVDELSEALHADAVAARKAA